MPQRRAFPAAPDHPGEPQAGGPLAAAPGRTPSSASGRRLSDAPGLPLEPSAGRPVEPVAGRPLDSLADRPLDTSADRLLDTSADRPLNTSADRPLFRDAAFGDRRAALAFRAVAVIVIATGLVRSLELLSPEPKWLSLLYFTQMSNLLCLGWMALAALRTARELGALGARGLSTPSARWAAAIMHAITVTMLIYIIVLVPTYDPASGNDPPFTLTDNLVHIFTPCLVILDWALFTPKGRIRWADPLRWILIPYAYLAFAVTYGALGGRFESGDTFAYPFLDFGTLGVGGVASWVATLTVALLAVAYVYVLLDRLLARAARPLGERSA